MEEPGDHVIVLVQHCLLDAYLGSNSRSQLTDISMKVKAVTCRQLVELVVLVLALVCRTVQKVTGNLNEPAAAGVTYGL